MSQSLAVLKSVFCKTTSTTIIQSKKSTICIMKSIISALILAVLVDSQAVVPSNASAVPAVVQPPSPVPADQESVQNSDLSPEVDRGQLIEVLKLQCLGLSCTVEFGCQKLVCDAGNFPTTTIEARYAGFYCPYWAQDFQCSGHFEKNGYECKLVHPCRAL